MMMIRAGTFRPEKPLKKVYQFRKQLFPPGGPPTNSIVSFWRHKTLPPSLENLRWEGKNDFCSSSFSWPAKVNQYQSRRLLKATTTKLDHEVLRWEIRPKKLQIQSKIKTFLLLACFLPYGLELAASCQNNHDLCKNIFQINLIEA